MCWVENPAACLGLKMTIRAAVSLFRFLLPAEHLLLTTQFLLAEVRQRVFSSGVGQQAKWHRASVCCAALQPVDSLSADKLCELIQQDPRGRAECDL